MSTARIVRCAALAAALLAGCGGNETGTAPAGPPRLTVGHVGHDHQIALYVAALAPEKLRARGGIWMREKKAREVYDLMDGDTPIAELHLVKVGGGSQMPAAMERGEIDVGLGGIPAVIFYVDKGAPFRILAPLNVDGDMLLVRPDFPADDWDGFVAAVRASEAPVRIGYKAPVAVAKLVFEGALKASGVPCDVASPVAGGVHLIDLKGESNVVPTLESGGIDGAVINEPVGSLAVEKGVGKIVSLLADLPPEGRWRSHPCCCICATEKAIADHRAVLVQLLAMLRASTALILEDRAEAARLAAAWTKQPEAVERRSVPNIDYVMDPGEGYRKGLETWFGIMTEVGKFQGSLKGKSWDEAFALVHDLSLVEEAEAR
jgi:NitT/TauT family transport system substrate-binding protein